MSSRHVVMAAHQPNFLPYLGFFDKMKSCDIFVIRDEVLYVERDFHHRNRIRINGDNNAAEPKFTWLNVPVFKESDYIKNIRTKPNTEYGGRHWKEHLLHMVRASYKAAPFYHQYYPKFEHVVRTTPDANLLDFNIGMINFFRDAFGIQTKMIMASDLGLKPQKYKKSDPSQDLVDICRKVGANVYLSGEGARVYLNQEVFDKAGIKLEYQSYHHPIYQQPFEGFLPFMSALDALFCTGGMPVESQPSNESTSVAN